MPGDQALSLIGLPYLLGQRTPVPRNSMALGPRRLLEDGELLGKLEEQHGPFTVELIEDADEPPSEQTAGYGSANVAGLFAGDQMSRILAQNIRLASSVREARRNGCLPLAFVGTCTAALGVVAGLEDVEKLGMIWFDAHDDAETPETSTSGLIEGMPVSMIAGRCWQAYCRQAPGFRTLDESRIATIGLHERYAHKPLRGSRAIGHSVNPEKIARLGFTEAVAQALDALHRECAAVYVHVDVDVLDPFALMASHHTAEGGLSIDQLARALTAIADRFRICALDFSSFDPTVDPRGVKPLLPLVLHAADELRRSNAA